MVGSSNNNKIVFGVAGATLLAITIGTLVVPVTAQTGSTSGWVPYTATYSELSSNPGQADRSATTTETRWSDGTILAIRSEHGRQSGRLWQGCGAQYNLDFQGKRAVYSSNAPKQHLSMPHVTPLGTQVVAGVSCTLFPVGVTNGNGTVCVDTGRDILVLEDVQMNSGLGESHVVKELARIDFSAPAASNSASVPRGFQILSPSDEALQGCAPRVAR